MRFPTPLIPATLLRRYKRFLADALLGDGTEVTAHVANPGRMTGLAEPGQRIWLERNDDPKRKLRYAWKLAEAGGAFVGVDTGAANRIVEEALRAGRIEGLQGDIRREVRYGDGHRADFTVSDTLVEVKSVTLCRTNALAEFPDTVTARGAKHMRALAQEAQTGRGAVVLFLVQRTDCAKVGVARDIDPAYASALDEAMEAGVQVLSFGCTITPTGITLAHALPPLVKPGPND